MKSAPASSLIIPNYGRMARMYRWLEYAAFGRALQQSRETFLERLSPCRSIAVFGAGDGRCFSPLLRAARHATIDAIDVDGIMIELARSRVAALHEEQRVAFVRADARTWMAKNESYDAIVTQYFLDCFTAAELDGVIPRLKAALKPNGILLFADFAVPLRPALARLRARWTIAVLCRFFQWQVNHPLRALPPMDEKLRARGFICLEEKRRVTGMVRSAVYQCSE